MKITDILAAECIRVPMQATDKHAAITELVALLWNQGKIRDYEEALSAVLARERTASTGIGEGLAVPHGKVHSCDRLVMAVGKPSSPIDFASRDGRPCEIVVLLASPVDKTGPHIQALAGISRLWHNRDLRRAVAEATTPSDLFEAIRHHES